MSKINHRGWWHDSTMLGTIIYYHDNIEYPLNASCAKGPFRTFTLARRDAIDYHRGNLEDARLHINELKIMRKPKGGYIQTGE